METSADVTAHLEIRGIQSFVFRTGRLRDTIGRSVLVESLTDPQQEPLRGLLNSEVRLHERRAGSFSVSGDTVAVRSFVAAYTRHVTLTSRELELVVAYEDPAVPNLAVTLARARLQAPAGLSLAPLLGVERCVLTGGSAETLWCRPKNDLPVAAEVMTARELGRSWHDRFEARALDPALRLALPMDMDSIAPSKQESSRAAVVVADLNGMGDKLRDWKALARTENAGDILRRCMEELGLHLARTAAVWVEPTPNGHRTIGLPEHLRFDLAPHTNDPDEPGGASPDSCSDLPFAPVILGGDDLVFLCESRLALGLVSEVIDFFATAPDGTARADLARLGMPFAEDGRITLTWGIGVAIDHVGYSLQRVHERAESLAKAAKRRRADLLSNPSSMPDHDAIAWTTLRREPGMNPEGQSATRVYVTSARATNLADWLRANHRQGVEHLEALLTLLDPTVSGSLRSDTACGGALPPWNQQRSWLKGHLAPAIRDHRIDLNLDSRQERRTRLSTDLAAQGPELAGVTRELTDHEIDLLGDALALLDEHLTLPSLAAATDQGSTR